MNTVRWRVRAVPLALLTMLSAGAYAQALPKASPESVGMSSQRLAKITEVIGQEVADKKLPGAVVMVARKGKLVYSQAFGSLNNAAGAPMREDSIFRLYSMTKPLVSTALMMLVEDGKVQLTDPVSKFLPSFRNPMVSVPAFDPVFNGVSFRLVAANREPTIQDLLRHTSGIAYGELTRNQLVRDAYIKGKVFLPDTDYDSRTLSGPEMADAVGKAPLAQQPGTTWEYSLSVDIQGRVVEVASGKRLNDFLQERMFKPLKMTDTAFHVPGDKAARLAEPFAKDPATGANNKLIDVSKVPGNDSGGAGGVGTAGDYLRYCQAMLNGGQLDGARILSPTTVRLMTSDHLAGINTTVNPGNLLLGSTGYTFGLGFLVRQGDGNAPVAGSAGEFTWAGYAGTYFWAEPKDQVCAVYMTQAPSPLRAAYRRLMKNLVSQAVVE
ncbi:MAG: class A beta-lactamase-related serine hydrolase [Betaproteobacteria bacterium]|jgi:CubicO group peptidase (beta-lactamase class C family)|nr:class A beta-lactamase-related serine hydrolase [Betaproteobacteria bacterium]